MRRLRILLAACVISAVALFTTSGVHALDVPPKPTDIPVVDQTGTLNEQQTRALADKIAAERQSSGNQIAILLIPTLDGDALEDYSLRVAREWGIGQSERDSGVLLLVVKDDRKLRIEVGYGLEGALTDARSSRIIRDRITPAFRENDYYKGVDAGLDGIILAVKDEKDPQLSESTRSGDTPQFSWELLFAALFVLPPWLASILARTRSWWAGGVIGAAGGVVAGFAFGWLFAGIAAIIGLAGLGLLFDWLVSRNFHQHKLKGDHPSWWAGGPWIGGSGGGNSGGYGGFGGGSFGGGGSSGSW